MAADGSSELPGCTAALTSSRLELTDEITGDCQHAEVAAVEDVAEKKIDEEDGLRKMNDELELRTQAQQELSLNTTAEQSDLEQGADSGEHAGCGARREEEEGEQGACVDEKAGRGTDGQAGSSQQARPDCILRAYLPQTPQAPVAVRSANMNGSLPDYKDLLEKKVLAHGERVLCTNRRGMRFFGDLLDDGTIRYSTGVTHSIHLLDPVFSFAGGVDLHACQAAFLQAVKLTPLLHRHSVIRILPSPELAGQTPELDVIFTSPTKFNNFIGQLMDPSYIRGNGFIFVYHKPPASKHWMPLDYYRWASCGRSTISYPEGFSPGDRPDKQKTQKRKQAETGDPGSKEETNFSSFPYGFVEGEKNWQQMGTINESEAKRIHALVLWARGEKALPRRSRDSITDVWTHTPKRKRSINARPDRKKTADIAKRPSQQTPAKTKAKAKAKAKKARLKPDGKQEKKSKDKTVISKTHRAKMLADFKPGVGDKMQFKFSKDGLTWMLGTVLRVFPKNQRFEACIEIPDSDTFFEQSITEVDLLSTYDFDEYGNEFIYPGDTRFGHGEPAKKKTKRQKPIDGEPARKKTKGEKSSQGAAVDAVDAAEALIAAAQKAADNRDALAAAFKSDEALTVLEKQNLEEAKVNLKVLSQELAKKETDLRKLAVPCDLVDAIESLQAQKQVLTVERSQLLEENGDRQCVVCWDRVSTVAINSCGHVCVCDACSGTQKECPLCRKRVVKTMRIFFSKDMAPLPELPHNFLRSERKRSSKGRGSQGVALEKGQGGGGERDCGGVSIDPTMLPRTPAAAAAQIEEIKDKIKSADEERSRLDASLYCGQCQDLFSTCPHSLTTSVGALKAKYEILLKDKVYCDVHARKSVLNSGTSKCASSRADSILVAQNNLLHERTALLEWDSAQKRCCVVCSAQVSGPRDPALTKGTLGTECAVRRVECQGCGVKPGCHRPDCPSLKVSESIITGARGGVGRCEEVVESREGRGEDARSQRASTAAVIPCGHVCICESCAGGGKGNRVKKCPWCQKEVEGFMRIFLS